ncbi:MAG: YoaK family protein [Gemmiger sp.]|nr:YoaK family protein [Gemmiger sp.]
MSDSLLTMFFITLSGGLQDAYTYMVRGKVFANAQTGNIVLMSSHLFAGEWSACLRYLLPVLSFGVGIMLAEQVRAFCQRFSRLHWRQIILLAEISLLFVVGCLPASANWAANILVSLACALQVQSFRKVNGYPYASTMCIGNLRSGAEAFSCWLRTRQPGLLHKAAHYLGVILLFALGSGLGAVLTHLVGLRAIWVSCGLLLISFALMFIEEHEKDAPHAPHAPH